MPRVGAFSVPGLGTVTPGCDDRDENSERKTDKTAAIVI
jgi:hypothetical protein